MKSREVDALISEGVIVRVRADGKAARLDLTVARSHLASAAAVVDSDPVGAFALAYDAMWKALVAHMRANGLRVRSGVGAHYQPGDTDSRLSMGRGSTERWESSTLFVR
ncbi:hypothetical protein BH18ACT13_BH18ACT13_21200 [soil metagenome]